MKYSIFLISILLFMILQSCSDGNSKNNQNTNINKQVTKPLEIEKSLAQKIIDKTIANHGGSKYLNTYINFDFRDKHYSIKREDGFYEYTRSFKNEKGEEINDLLNNDGFERKINNELSSLTDEWKGKYSNSVNSVAYFSMLPYGLNDAAVQKEYLGVVKIKEQSYHKIKISFSKEGGGEDFEDVFIYWIHKENSIMEYLAYSYHTDGGGKRFRAAYNKRNIKGIVFQDYVNYKEVDKTTSIENYDKLFEEGKLKELSRIENKNIEVQFLN